jgi:hypothetical protein
VLTEVYMRSSKALIHTTCNNVALTLSECSGLSQAQTRTLPVMSADATQQPLGENLATVAVELCPLYTNPALASSMSRTMMYLPEG